jgi:hypothetical protein
MMESNHDTPNGVLRFEVSMNETVEVDGHNMGRNGCGSLNVLVFLQDGGYVIGDAHSTVDTTPNIRKRLYVNVTRMLEAFILLACVVFFMYMWNRPPMFVPPQKAGCNTCGKSKNVAID